MQHLQACMMLTTAKTCIVCTTTVNDMQLIRQVFQRVHRRIDKTTSSAVWPFPPPLVLVCSSLQKYVWQAQSFDRILYDQTIGGKIALPRPHLFGAAASIERHQGVDRRRKLALPRKQRACQFGFVGVLDAPNRAPNATQRDFFDAAPASTAKSWTQSRLRHRRRAQAATMVAHLLARRLVAADMCNRACTLHNR